MEKYKVTQQFMDALDELNEGKFRYDRVFSGDKNTASQHIRISNVPYVISDWLSGVRFSEPISETIRRMAALADWQEGKDVFEVEKPHKFVVRSTKADVDGDYRWMYLLKSNHSLNVPAYNSLNIYKAKRFDTRMEAELWTTNGYEVVEVDGDGNEV